MLCPTETQRRIVKKEFQKKMKLLDEVSFKDLAKKDLKNNFFRDSKIKFKDLLMLLLGKVESGQDLGISSILSDLKLDKTIDSSSSRSSYNYRLPQIDPELFLEKLIDLNRSKNTQEYIHCVFDGTSHGMPDREDIRELFPKPKAGKKAYVRKPMAKLHYILKKDDCSCIDLLMKDHNHSERVALVELGIRAKDRGEKLHIIADRGLYGSAVGYFLQKLGHKFNLRCGGELMHKFKKLKFKANSATVTLTLYRSSIKPYKDLDIGREGSEFTCRIVRKKGTSKRKPIYIMTNDYDTPADDILEDYHNRQRIEDHFKYIKSYGGLEKIHPNTKLHMVRLIIAAIIFYISMLETILHKLIPTPSPEQKGERTANRRLSWGLFFIVLKNNIKDAYLIRFQEQILSNLLIIRPGRKAERYEYRIQKKKKSKK
jgi:hypothetical protein